MPALPQALRGRTPDRLRDSPRLRALALRLGLIPPRTMHSADDARLLLAAATGARRVVEIGVYEGASAHALLAVLAPGAELHLIDPFGQAPDALPAGWAASGSATRAALARAARRLRGAAPRIVWHIACSHEVAPRFGAAADLVFIDGDHSEQGCERDWLQWRELVAPGGRVVFHDARAGRPGGRGLPGPTAVVDRWLRSGASPGWEICDEADCTVVARRVAAAAATAGSG